MAICSLVFAFLIAPLGMAFGVVARNQIRDRGENGSELATAGIVLGWIFTIIGALLVFAQLILLARVASAVS